MQETIALTWATLTARLKNYRYGSYSCLALAAVIVTLLIFHSSWWLLGGAPAFILVGYRFVNRDQHLVFLWEDGVLAQWGKPDFVLGIFIQAIANPPSPLKNSLKSMLATLPPDPDFLTPENSRIRMARVLCWTRKATQDIRLYRSASLTLILASMPVLILGWLRTDIRPALLLLPPLIIALLQALKVSQAYAEWKIRLDPLDAFTLVEWTEISSEMEKLDWKWISVRLKKRFLIYPGKPT